MFAMTIRPPIVRCAAALLGLALAVALPSGPATADSHTLFSDDFEAGAGDWATPEGSWSVQGAPGARLYHQSSADRNARAFAGQTSWTNASVEASVRPAGFSAGSGSAFAAVLARVQGNELKTFNATADAGHVSVSTLDPVQAGALYVAPNGNDSNPGTLSQPLQTVQRAVELVQPGYTIYLRGGTYAPSRNIRILDSGTASQPITMRNYRDERVIIDGQNMPHTPAPVDATIPRIERGAIHIAADYWRLIGLEIINGPYGIFGIDSSNNIYEDLVTRDNYETGLHLFLSSSNNLILNLDSYRNRDPRKNGGSADGLAIKEGSGTGNVVRGARLWHNSDDGFDAWEFGSPILIEDSLAWGNGFNRWGLPNFGGHGIGFKLGGSSTPPTAHLVRNSMAWENAHHGFSDNGNSGAHRVERSTAWRNNAIGFMANRSNSTLTGNLAVGNQSSVSLGSGSSGSGNSWDIGGSWPLASTDPSTITGPRRPDGSIPSSSFLRPANGAEVGARF